MVLCLVVAEIRGIDHTWSVLALVNKRLQRKRITCNLQGCDDAGR